MIDQDEGGDGKLKHRSTSFSRPRLTVWERQTFAFDDLIFDLAARLPISIGEGREVKGGGSILASLLPWAGPSVSGDFQPEQHGLTGESL